MNNIEHDYLRLLKDILDNGVKKEDRTGTGTVSVFGRQIRHKMSEGFPLLTTKKMAWKTMVTELLWFLRGDTNIKFLVDNGCHIWDGDAYMNYLNNSRPNENDKDFHETRILISKEDFINKIKTDDEFAKQWGELGPIYGKQWRSWPTYSVRETTFKTGIYTAWRNEVDQIANLINDLKTNPDSRRLMVNAWNVGELNQMVLPPCHYGFQVYTRELSLEERLCIADKFNPLIREDCLTKTHHPDETEDLKLVYRHEFLDSLGPNVVPQRRAISLMWNQRSVDTFLGLPFNIASYGLLLEIIAKMTNMVPDELIGNLGDTHLYSNHIEQAKEQIGRELSLEERIELASKDPVFDPGDFGVGEQVTDEHCHEICDSYSVPRKTREPFELPTLNMAKTNAFWNGFDVSLLGHLDPTDFTIENYQSHPSIKAPLSN
jgi:thymidylate synthase